MVRIYGNRQIKTLRGLATRPTTARVREALFNTWQANIAGCRWLDLCCGSGAMGAEALCRGAASVVGIEQSRRACALIRHNWQQVVGTGQTFEVLQGNVLQHLRAWDGHPFDRIYFDPPYDGGLYQPVLEAIAQFKLLEAEGELAVEHRTGSALPKTIGLLALIKTKRYGETSLTFYHLARLPSSGDRNGDFHNVDGHQV